ncbi:hypothetical protein [Brevibacillus porteri]|uniref:DUF4367 domain-containing protein n=1 Tax=Brevibacillus porteri TaxID=2126350 RepID=A0ABX5FTG4_9BACL|nr:hypothetical protein [Brevibacillus porteri]MED1797363.1 hypothetical protein [Brevibacillus porteri]MED2129433.1 hypothetical protein [Brevibacillus porteri]MED2747644.1 hypothetical protein [Brevibacillus porteri]MED2815659.1 hypothetical protein [Brevibacillus porteri]MED2896772.1 hypothetical protein [Brevibacillus porteri]
MDKNPFNRMRDMLRAKPVPKVDVKHKVMAAIRAKENKEEKIVKKKIGLLVTVGMLVGASSVWAGVEMIQLKNEKGEVIYEITQHTDQEQQQLFKQMPPEEQKKREELNKRYEYQDEVVNEIIDGLKPGTSVAIYFKPTKEEEERQKNITWSRYKQPYITMVSTPLTYKSWKEMEPVVGKMFTLPTELAGGFRYDEGDVHYEENYEYEVDLEALKAKAIKENKDYAFTEIPSSNKYDFTSVAYKSEKGKVRVEVRIADGGKAGTNAEAMEKIMIGNNEAVLTTHTSNFHWITWVKNGTKLKYSVRAGEDVVSKDELINIAKQINEIK